MLEQAIGKSKNMVRELTLDEIEAVSGGGTGGLPAPICIPPPPGKPGTCGC